jgi:hypothetical protein
MPFQGMPHPNREIIGKKRQNKSFFINIIYTMSLTFSWKDFEKYSVVAPEYAREVDPRILIFVWCEI